MNKFNRLLKIIIDLKLKVGTYALFGSAPIVVRRIREFSGDIDIIVTKNVWNEYKNKTGWILQRSVKKNGEKIEALVNNNIELYYSWGPGKWDIKKLISTAENINGLRYVNLKQVLIWKKLNNRTKDIYDVKLINFFLKNNVDFYN